MWRGIFNCVAECRNIFAAQKCYLSKAEPTIKALHLFGGFLWEILSHSKNITAGSLN
jgi:hypothetical protein